eukprot:404253-Pelagomonas_calceolata.AAC.1
MCAWCLPPRAFRGCVNSPFMHKWFDAKERRLAEHGKQALGVKEAADNVMEVSSDSDSSE